MLRNNVTLLLNKTGPNPKFLTAHISASRQLSSKPFATFSYFIVKYKMTSKRFIFEKIDFGTFVKYEREYLLKHYSRSKWLKIRLI